MSEQVEKFDPSKMMDGVRDRIRATFASLIPDEAWDQMVKTVVNDYFYKVRDGYSNSQKNFSDFEYLIRAELDTEAKKRIADFFKSEGFASTWDSAGKVKISDKVKEMFIDNSGAILLGLLSQSFQMALNDLEMRLRNPNNRY